MPEATNSIDIHRPSAEVFAFLADAENDRRWRSGVLDIHLKSGQGKGAVYEQGVKGPFGRRVAADFEITEVPRSSRALGDRAGCGSRREPSGDADAGFTMMPDRRIDG